MFRKRIFGGAVRDLTLISQSRVELLKIKAYPLLNEKRRKNWRLWSLKSMQRKSQKIPWKEIPEQAPEVLYKYTLCLYDHTQFGVNVDDMFRKRIFGGAVRDLTLISQSRVELLKIKAYPLLNEKRRKNWRLWSLKSMQRKRNREVDYRYNIISRALYIRMGNSHRVTFQLHGN